ncbi:MAG: 4Fe-4S dicluster domain-containing protein [Myxococcota bacterium]|nr:4Fe-4S dicluster domain-containing protein [Myxococcota bacterium]
MPQFDRRDFLKLVGIGAGGAATGCYRYSDLPEKLIPYVVQPEEITPGLPVTYASTCLECSAGCGLHVRTREARPIKLEGNPDHPINQGALCARGQAGIGRTYHPDRFRGPQARGADGTFQDVTWEEATATLAEKVKAAGSRTWVLGGATGPTLSALIDRFVAAAGAGGRVVYEPFGSEALREASKVVFGRAAQPVFDLSNTDYVIDFGADSLDTGLSPTEHTRQLKTAREVTTDAGKKAHFVYVGPRLSTTASNADEWLPAKPGTEGILALGIARVAFEARRGAGRPVGGDPALIERALARFDAESVSKQTEIPADKIREIGRAIARADRPAALPPGVGLSSQRAVGATGAVLLLDAVVGAVGASVSLPAADAGPAASFADVAAFVDQMKGGKVSLLIVHDSNPLYSLPPGLGFAEALEKVDFVVSTASMPDETTEKADLVLPDHTPLESWGDAMPRAGVRSVVQPSLRPLFDTQALGDTLLATLRAVGGGAASGLPEGSFRQYVEAAWADTDWRAALARGGVFDSLGARGAEVTGGVTSLAVEEPSLEGNGEYMLLAGPSPMLYDGRGANLPWLQETPDPVTKITWQSWAEVSHETATALGVESGDVIAVETSAGRAEVPVFTRGGIRNDVVALAIGQGHTVGSYASADGAPRGVNVNAILPAARDEAGGRAWFAARASLTPTGAHRRFASTQYTNNKRGRQLGEAITLAAFEKGDWNTSARSEKLGGHGERDHGGGNVEVGILAVPAAGGGHGEGHGTEGHAAPAGGHGNGHGDGHGEGFHELLRPFERAEDAIGASPYRWAMNVDLDRCTGCSACVVACSIENNVPQVGEEGLLRSREMSWLRIERFVGEGTQELVTARKEPTDFEKLGETDVRHSPMMCQQCGAAPCEPVCPVFATYHNEEGLNGMIYNRCIGTRYCANNCPYKVRRFNWYDYQIETWPEPMRYMLNPDVTVRGQGVMEKCTFCVQRIQSARQTAKDERRNIADGEVTPACAQTCPSEAITFGNVRDEGSRVVKQAQENEGRVYHALQVLNTRPGVTYLAKVRRSGHEESHG